MQSIFTLAAATALLACTNVVALEQPLQGCFTSTTGLTFNSTWNFNAVGYCGPACIGGKYAVFAMSNYDCYCGNTIPPALMKTSDSDCTQTCPGYPTDACGGQGAWSVYLTGLTSSAKNAAGAASDISSATTSKTASSTPATTMSVKPSVVTAAGQTIVVTAVSETSTGASNKPSSGKGPSVVGIAVGVVVGVIAIAGILGGLFLFMRNQKRKEIEEEYKRNAAVSSFIGGGKPPPSAGSSFTDMRLDPAVMAQRRMSDGSIADNTDYSRRILKVTNA